MSRLEDLADRIVFAHEADVDAQLPTMQDREHDELERTAALVGAATAEHAPLPPTLSARLAADALAFCAERRAPAADREPPGFTTPRPSATGNVLSFVLGAAAAALVVWLSLSGNYERSLAELRAQTLANDPTVRQKEWAPGPSPLRGDVSGDVVWSQQRQDGWLTIRNLPVLPADKAYQLWIVDGEREGAPVDGGVFTIAKADGETLVDIDPKLPIARPAAFVITVEDKAGVVVSKQEHVVAIASL